MPSSARLGGRRALIATALTAAGLLATAVATVAQPLPESAQNAAHRPNTIQTQRGWVAARVDAVRPVPDLAQTPRQDASRVMARYDGIDLLEPNGDALAIGFHQAGGDHPALTPVGKVLANDNPRGTASIDLDDQGPDVRVMASRGRGGSGTSAVDVALPADAPVHAVVTGTVTKVASYALYGRHDDVLVEIQPEGRPDVRVVLYHLADIQVSVGDPVYAGLTPVAGAARHIPVANQVDRFAGDCPCAHVDIRIRKV